MLSCFVFCGHQLLTPCLKACRSWDMRSRFICICGCSWLLSESVFCDLPGVIQNAKTPHALKYEKTRNLKLQSPPSLVGPPPKKNAQKLRKQPQKINIFVMFQCFFFVFWGPNRDVVSFFFVFFWYFQAGLLYSVPPLANLKSVSFASHWTRNRFQIYCNRIRATTSAAAADNNHHLQISWDRNFCRRGVALSNALCGC